MRRDNAGDNVQSHAHAAFLEKAMPAVAQGMMPKKFAAELLMFGVRSFQAGPQIEELLDEWSNGSLDQQGGQAPDPAKAAQEAEIQKQAAHQDALRKIELETNTATVQ